MLCDDHRASPQARNYKCNDAAGIKVFVNMDDVGRPDCPPKSRAARALTIGIGQLSKPFDDVRRADGEIIDPVTGRIWWVVGVAGEPAYLNTPLGKLLHEIAGDDLDTTAMGLDRSASPPPAAGRAVEQRIRGCAAEEARQLVVWLTACIGAAGQG